MLPLRPLPLSILATLAPFAPLFSRRVWAHVQILVAGSLLSPARRTVAAALRVLGLAHIKQFHRYHRVLSRAKWSSLAVSRILLGLLVAIFAPDGPLVVGVDETLERRRGGQDRRQGHLSRPGPLEPLAFHQSEWSALDLPDAAGPDPVGGTNLSVARPDRPRPV